MQTHGCKMPKLATPLTDIQVRNSKAKEKTWTLADGNGLYLEIAPSGKKRWRMPYRRPATKKNNRLSFGDYPLIGLAEARTKCLAARRLLIDDIDPADNRDEQRQLAADKAGDTFEKIAREWHNTRMSGWSPSTAKDIIGRLGKDIFPQIGKLAIAAITHQQMIAALRKVEERGAGEVAHRLKATCAHREIVLGRMRWRSCLAARAPAAGLRFHADIRAFPSGSSLQALENRG